MPNRYTVPTGVAFLTSALSSSTAELMWLTRIPTLALKTRITLVTLLVFIVSIWSLLFFANRMLRQDIEKLLGEQQLSTVNLLANQINAELTNRVRALEKAAASSAPIMSHGSAAMQTFIDERITLQVLFNGGLMIINPQGKVISDFPFTSGRLGSMQTDDEGVVAALEGRSSIGRPEFEKTVRSPAFGTTLKSPVFTMTVPIWNEEGRVIGALAGITNLGLPGFLDLLTENSYGKNGGYLLIAPSHHLIITSTNKRRIMEATLAPGTNPVIDRFLIGETGSAVHVNPRGIEMLSSSKAVPLANWLIVADLPTTEAFAPIHEVQNRMRQATLFLTLLAGLLISWLLRRELYPLFSTAKRLADMADKKHPLQPLPVARHDEIGQLIGGFNHLLDMLGQREHALLETEWKFRALFEKGPIGVAYHAMIYDAAGKPVDYRFLDANESFQKLVGGINPCGKTILQVLPQIKDDPFDWIGTFGLVARSGKQIRFEQYFQSNDHWYDCVVYQYKPDHFVAAFLNITKRKQAETALREKEEKYRLLIEGQTDLIVKLDPENRFLFASPSFCHAFGTKEHELIGQTLVPLVHKEDLAATIAAIDSIVQPPYQTYFEHRAITKTGYRWFGWAGKAERDKNGRVTAITGIGRDITEHKLSDERLHLAASVFSHAREGIMITGTDGVIIDVNDSFTRISGYGHDEVLGLTPRLLNSGRHEQPFYAAMWNDLVSKGHWYGEVWNRRKNGEIFASMQTISTVNDSHGKARYFVSLFSDITALKEHEKQLEHIAHYDVLTTLPNRVLLADRMHQAMAQAHRREQRMAVAYLDLDGFKSINDHHGHEAGDQLLITVSERMKQTLRESDTLARLGGDEFIVVMLDLADFASSVPMINRLLAAAAQPVTINGNPLQVSASLGVTFYPQNEVVDADQLLRQADQAMYQAKLAGKNRYHIFDAEQDRSVRGHHESLEHIRRALIEHEFVLHYQPKVNMRSGTLIGAEALIRWQHPEHGMLPPGSFLPVIEDHRLTVDIGEWVIDNALGQMERWHAVGLTIPVSVNVSAHHLQQPDFVDRLRQLLSAHPSIPHGRLEIEVLETSALEDLARISAIIEECQTIGVSFSLDDFGTGYSSLTYLKNLSVTQLKIDQSFVQDMLDDPDDLSILGGVLSLATAFRRQVIAEGVETVAHGTMLLQLGCELAQGYGIARPMPAADFPAWAASWKPDAAWSDQPAVNRDDLPLLFAIVEHRAWIVAVEEFIMNKREMLPLVHHQCRFDSWLAKEGRLHHGEQAVFQNLTPLHRRIHALAQELCETKAAGRDSDARNRLGELRELRNLLLEQLQSLVEEGQQQANF